MNMSEKAERKPNKKLTNKSTKKHNTDEIYKLFSKGLSNKEICTKFGLAKSTVSGHKKKWKENKKQIAIVNAIHDMSSVQMENTINDIRSKKIAILQETDLDFSTEKCIEDAIREQAILKTMTYKKISDFLTTTDIDSMADALMLIKALENY